MPRLTRHDRLGLLRPALDAHTLGLYSAFQVLADSGVAGVIAGREVCAAGARPEDAEHAALIGDWIRRERLTALGFSYRLDPRDGAARPPAAADRTAAQSQVLAGRRGRRPPGRGSRPPGVRRGFQARTRAAQRLELE